MATPPIPAPHRPALPALTGIRAFAAYAVLLWHSNHFLDGMYPVQRHGYLGVDLFFMLSGFILCYVHGEEMLRPTWRGYGRFLILRLGRIWPAYIAALLFVVLPQAVRQDWPSGTLGPEALRFLAHLLMLQNWGIDAPDHYNWPAWSVSAEWFLYLLFPLLLLALGRASWRRALILIPALLALLAVALNLNGIAGVYAFGPLGLLRALAEFGVGILLWRLYSEPRTAAWRWDAIGATAALLLLVCTVALDSETNADFILLVLFPPLLLSLAYHRGPLAWICASRPLLFLGEASYAIYLVNWGCLWRVQSLATSYGDTWPAWLRSGTALSAMTLIASTALGIVLHFVVERPCRRFVRRRLGYA